MNKSHLFSTLLLITILFSACKKDTVVPPVVVPTEPTPFANVPATSDIVMYEVNERAFSSSGNFAGITARLDSIKALGVNVVWLMPIHPIGTINSVNSSYSIKNYKGVNPEFGTLADLKTLVNKAHDLDMAVILDWAANHTAWDNAWVQEHPTWYTQDASGNIIHPAGTNWQDVADLNFANDTMRLEMIKSMKYWVTTANIDGFRCDAADYVPFAFWKQAIDSLNAIPNRDIIMLAEGARSDHFSAGFQMNFGWNFFTKNKDVFKNNQAASGYYSTHTSEYASIPSGSHKLRFISNHDECAWDDTAVGLFGGQAGSVAAFAINTYMGGVPLIYNGQEVGCTVKLQYFSNTPINWNTNPTTLRKYQRLMTIRAAHPALRNGDLVYYNDTNIAAFKRQKDADEVLVLVNTRNAAQTFTIPAALQSSTWQDALTTSSTTLGTTLSFGAYEYRIFTR